MLQRKQNENCIQIGSFVAWSTVQTKKKSQKQTKRRFIVLHITRRVHISLCDFLILTEYLTKRVCARAPAHMHLHAAQCDGSFLLLLLYYYSSLFVHSISISYRLATLESKMTKPMKKNTNKIGIAWAWAESTRALALRHGKKKTIKWEIRKSFCTSQRHTRWKTRVSQHWCLAVGLENFLKCENWKIVHILHALAVKFVWILKYTDCKTAAASHIACASI